MLAGTGLIPSAKHEKGARAWRAPEGESFRPGPPERANNLVKNGDDDSWLEGYLERPPIQVRFCKTLRG